MKIILTSQPSSPTKSTACTFRITALGYWVGVYFRRLGQRSSKEEEKPEKTGWVHAWRAEVKHFFKGLQRFVLMWFFLMKTDWSWDTTGPLHVLTKVLMKGAPWGCCTSNLTFRGRWAFQEKNVGSRGLTAPVFHYQPFRIWVSFIRKVVIPITSISC